MAENGERMGFHDNYGEKTTLAGIKFKRILMDSAEKKLIFVEAEVEGSSDPAVVILDKLPFTEESVKNIISADTSLEPEMQNDIYGQYRLLINPIHNPVKANIIHPATQKHIEKYKTSPSHLVQESPELYQSVTLPFIQSEQFSLGWVYNFLEHKKEQERIIFEDPDPVSGFMMAPDFKWTGKQIEDLYCLAIVHKRGIKSLRDLNRSHLPLLYNLEREGKKAIQDKYGLKSSKIRAYFHYQPSYYHLHVHFTNLEYTPPGVNCEKSHCLETVISNLELSGSFYKTATLNFVVREKDKIYAALQKHGYFSIKSGLDTPEPSDSEFEDGDCGKVLEFMEMLGRSKHEPSGEFWETTYGESAWRMSIMCLCLPESLDRKKLVSLCLVSSLSSLGSNNDENTQWELKIKEVDDILRSHLPAEAAGRLSGLFHEHAEVRRGRLDGSAEHITYRGILELEEYILRLEEEQKGSTAGTLDPTQILVRMAELQFPGSTRFKYFKDKALLEKALKFIFEISKLQRLKRTGWVKCQVRDPETVAAHMFRMGVMGLIFSHKEPVVPGNGLNVDACIISLCHDMAECIIGDITPHCKVPEEEKAKKEMLAFTQLVENLPESIAMDLLISFRRYEDQKAGDHNAILTKDFDKFDMILQAFEYEKKEKRGKFLQQFFDTTMSVFKTKAVKKWHVALLKVREQYFNQVL